MEKNIPQKNDILFECIVCNYSTSNKKDYTKHKLTAKHTKRVNGNIPGDLGNEIIPDATFHKCNICSNQYETISGLWKHKKKCSVGENANTELITTVQSEQIVDFSLNKDIIMMLLKENSELKNMMIKEHNDVKEIMMKMMETAALNSNSITNTMSNNTTNSHNKIFNLQFFLNETCKDAMNISEFIENIKVDVSDLENMGRVGYVEGMSSILIKNLNFLEITRRPIHCTDKKREIMYIKDNNIWEKDDEERNKLHKTIKRLSHKNIKVLPAYREKYPGCEFAISRFSDNYNKMIVEVMGGPGDNDDEKEDKIIQKIAKYITINKGIPIEE